MSIKLTICVALTFIFGCVFYCGLMFCLSITAAAWIMDDLSFLEAFGHGLNGWFYWWPCGILCLWCQRLVEYLESELEDVVNE